MPASSLKRFVKTSVGGTLYRCVGPLLRLSRRVANPGVAPDRTRVRVDVGERTLNFELRRWSSNDACAIQQCFTDAQYAFPAGAHTEWIAEKYREIIASGKQPLILDCGANIGCSVGWFAVQYPQAHIVAIEPAPGNFELLLKNTDSFDADCRLAAVSGRDGQAYLINQFGGSEMSFQISDDPSGIPIEIVSINTLLDQKPEYTPFLIKVDIEGAEKMLFTGDTSGIARFPVILVEPHDWQSPGERTSRNFLRFHVESDRDLAILHENIASLAIPRVSASPHPSSESSAVLNQ